MAAMSGTAIVALVLAAAAAATSAYGVVQQGRAQEKASKFQAAAFAQQAKREREIAAANERDFRRQQSRLLARRRALMGVSGVETATGSPLLVAQDFVGETELQALRVRRGGEIRATRLEQQSQLERFRGRNARTQGYLRGGALILGTASKAFSMGSSFGGGGGGNLYAGGAGVA